MNDEENIKAMNMTNKKVGLVLSGGGVRGMAHIGAIQALEEQGIFPEIVSGSSAGAVVGALYCHGYSPAEMKRFFAETPLFHISRFAFGKPGFIDTDKFFKDFIQYFRLDDFSSLKKKLYVTTVDMLKGEKRIFSEGELIRPLLASSAFPGLFSPVCIEEVLYADGGILDNFPIEPIETEVDYLVGSYVSPLDTIQAESLKYSVNVLERAIRINYSKRSRRKFDACDILFRPSKLVQYGLLDVNKLDVIYQIGYEAARQELQKEITISAKSQ
jgi:NTE family protein